MKCGLIIDPKDNVVVVTEEVKSGDTVAYRLGGEEFRITASQDVPIYHKIARTFIPKESAVMKYGQVIGKAVEPIEEGQYVHCHNVKSMTKEVL